MNEIVIVKDNEIIINEDFIKKYKDFKKVQLEMEIAEKEFKEELKNAMESIGKKDLILDGFSATIKNGSTRTTLDTTRIKKELPQIFEEYSKTTEVGSTIILKVE